jgi:predicted CoA-binding protein
MATERASLETIKEFLALKRIAMVGVSRDPASFSAKLFEELCRQGYDVVPVNPNAAGVQGRRCFARVQDVWPAVEGALLMTSPEATGAVVRDCADAGIGRVWMYRAAGKGAVSEKAVAFCRGRGIKLIPGECPLMFMADTASFHHFHGFLRKITGRYPRHRAA